LASSGCAGSYLEYDPFMRKVRGDPRYAALPKKMNLPLD
jgi:hypothetical protein